MARSFLDKLWVSKSAQFFRINERRPLSKTKVEELFRAVSMHRLGNPRCRIVRKRRQIGGAPATISCLVFRFENEPAFLSGSNERERKYALLLLIEFEPFAVVFKRNVPSVDTLLAPSLKRVDYNTLSKLFMTDETQYEKFSLKNMTVSPHAVRARSVEAPDLRNAMSTLGASRSIVTSLRLAADGEIVSVVPSSSKVAAKAPKERLSGLVVWSRQVAAEIAGFVDRPGFIDNFARPLSLSDLPLNVVPAGLLLDLGDLETALKEQGVTEIARADSAARRASTLAEPWLRRFVARSRESLHVHAAGGTYEIRVGHRTVGEVRRNAASMTLRSPLLDRLRLQMPNGDVKTLGKYLNEKQRFMVTFSDPQYVYFSKRIFEDRRLLGNVDGFLSIFSPDPAVAAASDEKGKVEAGQPAFLGGTLFELIERSIAASDTFLACDDLGDEWADYVGINNSDESPSISFYHAKHAADLTLGASAFQVIVAQAQKNLGRLNPTEHDLSRKRDVKWLEPYGGENVASNINRVRRGGTPDDVVRAIQAVLAKPNALRRVVIVVSFLSKQRMADELQELRAGRPVPPHVVQLLWLLSGFIHECREMGAQPTIICGP